jgi:tetratricopeptide (TPR) repeat protein
LLEAVIVGDRASVDYEGQRWAAAAKEYLHAIELGADDIDCLECPAYAQIKAGDWPQAVKLYTRLLEKKPNDATALSSRGWAYDRIDNPHAVEDFTAADQGYPDGVKNLQMALAESQPGTARHVPIGRDFTEIGQLQGGARTARRFRKDGQARRCDDEPGRFSSRWILMKPEVAPAAGDRLQ